MIEEKKKYENSLYRRFVMRVLVPPFLILMLLGIVGLWVLGNILHQQAIGNMKSSAVATAATLNREFSLRETILKQTGAEMFIIKSTYLADRKKLDENYEACRIFVRQKASFSSSPNGVCEPFLRGAANGTSSLAALQNEYVALGNAIVENQNQRINERLAAYKQFFPETLALLVVDDDQAVVSSALSGVFKGSSDVFLPDAIAALKAPVMGKTGSYESFKLVTFAYPIAGGSVLAAYDVENEMFIRQAWQSAPIDRTRSLAVVLDGDGTPVYPDIKDNKHFVDNAATLRQSTYAEFALDTIDHTVVTAPVGDSKWLVAIASPTAAVLAPLRDAQLIGIIVVGLFMVGFFWMGTFFIQRMLRNIIRLVSGAMVFGSGRLDYKIALDHADSEFMRLGDTMNLMARRLAQAEKEIDEKNKEFISLATHEIRAPLTAIIGHISLLKDMYGTKLDPQANGLIDQAYYSTARLRDLVNDMLNVARLESGRSEFALVPVAVKNVIAEVVSNMTVVADMAHVRLEYKDKGATDVLADEGRLRIIINNFVSNAIKYNRPKGTVTISHQLNDNQLVTVIADDGLGIPEDQKEHMFEKFFRVEHEDRKSVTGTGLGMYITKQYIEQMQGKLWYESTHGHGTKFYFSLPVAKVRLRTQLKDRIKKLKKKKTH